MMAEGRKADRARDKKPPAPPPLSSRSKSDSGDPDVTHTNTAEQREIVWSPQR